MAAAPPARSVGKNWAITQLGRGTSLELQVTMSPAGAAREEVRKFTIAQYTASFAINEIPAAQCMLAMGRDVRELVRAEIHASASRLRQMRRARVIFRPTGEFDPDGTPWPAEFVVFDGYFMGLGYSKINGKVQVIANLEHWLVDLACSSTLTNNSHPLNPAHLTARAVMLSLTDAGASKSHYISQLPGVQLIRQDLVNDLWGGIKKLFCGLASFRTAVGSTEEEGNCGGTDNANRNTRARLALSRMEGPARGGTSFDCSKVYKYGVPLHLDLLNVQDAEDAIAKAVSESSVESFANTTFWDKLVNEYCPSFGLAVVPCVDYALVVADTPAFRGGPWKAIEPDEYDSFNMQMKLERPLRAVGVTVQFGSFMGVPEGMNTQPTARPVVGGCFSANIDEPDDGVIQYVSAPRWLQVLATHEPYAGGTTGVAQDKAGRSDTTPAAVGGATPPATGSIVEDVNQLLNQYAHSVFVANMLKGRVGSTGGKLRFDIGPASIITVRGSEERFLAGEDELATDMVGCVTRVTVAINAEGAIAGTTFSLSHLRTSAENQEDRTSVTENPLFQDAIHGGGKHGSPLVIGHELLRGG